jgi:glycosyltransferase involved in cell wall biosynthesis
VKKKSLIFIEDGSFTYDNRVIREANALAADGWTVTVICPKYPDDPFVRDVGSRIRVYYYPKPSYDSLAGHAVEAAFTLVFGSLWTLWAFIRRGFSVFHACNPMDILWLIALPYKGAGKRFLFDQHDLVPELMASRTSLTPRHPLMRALLFLERRSYRLADTVIATNESYKETAVSRGGKNPDDVFVVRNGPDLRKFRLVPPMTGLKENGQILVGYLGNMNPQDGVDHLLKAAETVVHRHGRQDIRFLLIGGGGAQPGLVELSRSLGLENNVSFTGRIPDDAMLSSLNACDICVQPDPFNPLNDKSTMNKVMEYMALEKPVVAYDLKETRVSGGDAVLYARPDDVDGLARAIMALADQPGVRAQMGRKGRERVENRLSWEHSVPFLLAAYRHALAGESRGAGLSRDKGSFQDGHRA